MISARFPGNITVRKQRDRSKIVNIESRRSIYTSNTDRNSRGSICISAVKGSSGSIEEILGHNRSVKPVSSVGRRKCVALRIGHPCCNKSEQILTTDNSRNRETWGKIHNRQFPIDSIIGKTRSTQINRPGS